MNATPLTGWIEGIGFIAPGLPDWPTLRAVLRGEQAYVAAPSVLPVPAILPAAERRRASRIIKLTLAIGQEAAAHAEVDVSTLATVFSASGADGHNCHAICEQLASDDRQISPTRFHNSVHNAAAGYWGIATHSMAPSQVICAFNAGFGAGIIDTLGQVVVDHQTTLLIAYDSEYPEPLHSKRPVPDVGGIALVISPARTVRSLAQITVTPTTLLAETLADRELEACRNDIPALRCLPLLQKLARGESGPVCLDYLRDMQLSIDLQLC